MFGTNKTIEFRCHVPTRDPIKVLNWLYICSAIIKYADIACRKNVPLSQLKGIVLKDVITEHYSTKLSNYLLSYIEKRKANRIDDDMRGDYIGETEIQAENKDRVLYTDIV